MMFKVMYQCMYMSGGQEELARVTLFVPVLSVAQVPRCLFRSRVYFGVQNRYIPKVVCTDTHLRGELHGTWEYEHTTTISNDESIEWTLSMLGKHSSRFL
ncbi:hypothetical protein DPSP01_009645 [Paraphaeosphaeria sporulosa]